MPAVVAVQVGQAGNELGCGFFDAVATDPAEPHPDGPDALERWFHHSEAPGGGCVRTARAVLVDMEPKVVGAVATRAAKSGRWLYRKGAVVSGKRGAGNSWAMGYTEHGPKAAAAAMERVRREAERSDGVAGFVVCMSVAGGTGSGVGTRITEALREEYAHSVIANQVVWPFTEGEVIVQNYNAALSLARLYGVADAVVLAENDAAHAVCSRMLGRKKVTLDDMNAQIGATMAGYLAAASGAGGAERTLADLVAAVSPNPEFKLLTARAVPQIPEGSRAFTKYQWPGLLLPLRQMLIANAPCEAGINWRVQAGRRVAASEAPRLARAAAATGHVEGFNPSLANLLFLRGAERRCADTAPFLEPALYASGRSGRCQIWSSAWSPSRHRMSATLLSNSHSVWAPVESVMAKAWTTFSARAYVHQYAAHGVDEDAFVDSFIRLEQIIASYKGLAT